jgi:hypothetical protein
MNSSCKLIFNNNYTGKMHIKAFKYSKNSLGLYPGYPVQRGRGGEIGENVRAGNG